MGKVTATPKLRSITVKSGCKSLAKTTSRIRTCRTHPTFLRSKPIPSSTSKRQVHTTCNSLGLLAATKFRFSGEKQRVHHNLNPRASQALKESNRALTSASCGDTEQPLLDYSAIGLHLIGPTRARRSRQRTRWSPTILII